MKRMVAIGFDDGNLSGFGWSWQFMVTRRKDGTFSVSAKQTTADPPGFDPRQSNSMLRCPLLNNTNSVPGAPRPGSNPFCNKGA